MILNLHSEITYVQLIILKQYYKYLGISLPLSLLNVSAIGRHTVLFDLPSRYIGERPAI